jgi:hypothetical protein
MSLGFVSPPAMLAGLPDGVAGTRATLKMMARLVRQYKKDPGINLTALEITRGIESYDTAAEVTALQHFVRDRIKYRMDVEGVETLRTPPVTLQMEAGDCDDKATLLCTLLATIGYSCAFFAVGFNGVDFSHVLAGVRLGSGYVPLETIVPGAEPGWFPPGADPTLTYYI